MNPGNLKHIVSVLLIMLWDADNNLIKLVHPHV